MLNDISFNELSNINGIGPEIAKSIIDIVKDKEFNNVVNKLKKAGLNFKENSRKISKVLDGKTFIFTGSLTNYGRADAENIVRELGGNVVSSISKKIDYVVLGDEPGSKFDKAKSLGLKIIEEEEFKKIIGE
jgi:DNA ligase (NAD+)